MKTVMAHGDSNTDFNRNKGVHKLGLLCGAVYKHIADTFLTLFLTVAY